MTKTNITMEELLAAQELNVPQIGDVIEGNVINITKNGLWLDLGALGTGLVVGPEISDFTLTGDEPKTGDKMSASVICQETDEGYVLLSLRKATREKIWDRLAKMMNDGEVFKVKAFDANKGGLLIEYEGVRGFLPVSQLSTEHYPRVSDKDEILSRLMDLAGKPLDVVVLDFDRKENKLIFSEKAASREKTEELLSKFKLHDKAKGRVTGVVDFGIFLNVHGVEGLIHISEISWDRVENPSDFVKVGDEVEVVIIGIEDEKISLSMKRLQKDPWLEKVKDIHVGDIVDGSVTRITPFGAFVRLLEGIEALVHISELSDDHISAPSEVVEEGKEYKFKIISVDVDSHKLALSLKGAAKENKEVKKTVPVKKETKLAKEKAVKKTIKKAKE